MHRINHVSAIPPPSQSRAPRRAAQHAGPRCRNRNRLAGTTSRAPGRAPRTRIAKTGRVSVGRGAAERGTAEAHARAGGRGVCERGPHAGRYEKGRGRPRRSGSEKAKLGLEAGLGAKIGETGAADGPRDCADHSTAAKGRGQHRGYSCIGGRRQNGEKRRGG